MSRVDACSHCARTTPALTRVPVALLGDPEVKRELTLCSTCLMKPGATWRLRWRPLEPAAAWVEFV